MGGGLSVGVRVLRAVLVTPLSGPLARFGSDGAQALAIWARRAARPVDLAVHDAHPDAAAAMRAAVATEPDLVFGPYGSGPGRAAVGATNRLVWNHGGATVDPSGDSSGDVVNILSPADTYLEGAIEAVRDADPSADTLVLINVDSGFGRAVAGGAESRARALGFDVTRIPFSSGDAASVMGAVPTADVLCVAGGFGDELELGRALLSRSWRAAVFVGAGEEGVLADLGAQRDGLLGPCQWLAGAAPEPEIGPSAEAFVEAFRSETGSVPSYPAVQAFAAGILAEECVRRGGSTDDAAVHDVARALDTTTLYGRFRLDPVSGRQVGHRVLTVQWQGGRRHVVWPPERATARFALRPG